MLQAYADSGLLRRAARMSGRIENTASTKNVVVRPKASPILPNTGAVIPPTLTDRPSVTPDARPTWLGRYCCPRSTIGL